MSSPCNPLLYFYSHVSTNVQQIFSFFHGHLLSSPPTFFLRCDYTPLEGDTSTADTDTLTQVQGHISTTFVTHTT